MREKKYSYKASLAQLKEDFPEVLKINVQYMGSGDSFEDFWDQTVECKDGKDSTIDQSEYEDLLWYAIENSDADFNNDGSEGTITIDLENQKLSIDNYYRVMETNASGNKVFE
jgi:hypothetical protein